MKYLSNQSVTLQRKSSQFLFSVLLRTVSNPVTRFYKAFVNTLLMFMLWISAQSYAAVPADVTTAMADMQADAVAVATVFLVAIIALAAFKLMRRGAN